MGKGSKGGDRSCTAVYHTGTTGTADRTGQTTSYATYTNTNTNTVDRSGTSSLPVVTTVQMGHSNAFPNVATGYNTAAAGGYTNP